MLFISPKRCASGFALSLLLIGCTLPPITRVSSVDVAVMDSPNFDVTAVDDLATPPDVLLTDVPIDVLRDVAVSGDGGVVFPATIQAQVVFRQATPLLRPPTIGGYASRLVMNSEQIVATAGIVEDVSGISSMQLFSRPRSADGMWEAKSTFAGLANTSALSMDIENNLHLVLTCQRGDCGHGLMSPGFAVTALLRYAPMLGMTYNFNTPVVDRDLTPSQGYSSVGASRRSNEIYVSHLLLDTRRKIQRSTTMAASYIDNAASGSRLPLLVYLETTALGLVFALVSNTTRGDGSPMGYSQLTLFEFVNGVLTLRNTINAEMPRPLVGTSEYGVAAAGMESAPDGTLYIHAHGRFDSTNCTRIYRREPGAGGAINFTALGCRGFGAQLQVIDNSQLLLVEPFGAVEGMRIGHSADRGETWTWRDVSVTFNPPLVGAVRFAAPSLVRPATSPNAFDPHKVRMLFSLSIPESAGTNFSGMAYAEFSLR